RCSIDQPGRAKVRGSMQASRFLAVCGSCVVSSAAFAANIYVMSSGDAATDAGVVAALTSFGHTVTVGDPFNLFVGTENLSGFQTVYIQAHFDCTSPAMPTRGLHPLHPPDN